MRFRFNDEHIKQPEQFFWQCPFHQMFLMHMLWLLRRFFWPIVYSGLNMYLCIKFCVENSSGQQDLYQEVILHQWDFICRAELPLSTNRVPLKNPWLVDMCQLGQHLLQRLKPCCVWWVFCCFVSFQIIGAIITVYYDHNLLSFPRFRFLHWHSYLAFLISNLQKAIGILFLKSKIVELWCKWVESYYR